MRPFCTRSTRRKTVSEVQVPSPDPPEGLVAALAWCQLHRQELVPTLEALWESHQAGSTAARAGLTLLVIGWESGRAWQANAQRQSPPTV